MTEIRSYPEVRKWLMGKKESTKHYYITALDAYMEFTGLNPTELIDEVEADREKKVRERGLPEQRIKGFREWLITKYQQKTRGRRESGKKRRNKVGVSETLASTYSHAVKGFYRDNGFKLDVKLKKGRKKKVNFKLILRSPEISKLLNVATSLRDKAIIKFMYESSQGVSEVSSLNYGDIKEWTVDGEEIWQFHMIRKKTNTEYYTEIGEECIELLKLYFEERERNGEKLTALSPVFIKEGKQKLSKQRITPNLIENMLKTLALKSGLVTKEQMKLADLNPARPHALRSSSISVLKLAGYPEQAVEFRCGHALNGNDQAYFITRPEELRQLFRKQYHALRVQSGSTQINEERLKKLESMLTEREYTIGALRENGILKIEEVKRLRKDLEEQRKTINQLEQTYGKELDSLTKKYENIKKLLEKEEEEPEWSKQLREKLDEYHKIELARVQELGYKDLKEYFRAMGEKVGKQIKELQKEG